MKSKTELRKAGGYFLNAKNIVDYPLRGESSMNRKLFSIGEISAIKGITVKALRFYEKIGLLIPCYINPSNRYRF
jgi:hypothetical protein